jgi:hypothetical protein
MAKSEPLAPRVDGGRDLRTGRFAAGNKCGRGDPLAGRAAKIRAILLQTLTPAKAKRIARKLLEKAEQGDLAYIRELLDRTIGKPSTSDLAERVEQLEKVILERRTPWDSMTESNG